MTRLLLVVLVAATITGCGKKNTSKKPGDTGDGRGGVGAPGGEPTAAQRAAGNDLKKLAIAYHDYIFQHNKPPANIADLAKFAPGDLIGKVQSGTYTLQMNVGSVENFGEQFQHLPPTGISHHDNVHQPVMDFCSRS